MPAAPQHFGVTDSFDCGGRSLRNSGHGLFDAESSSAGDGKQIEVLDNRATLDCAHHWRSRLLDSDRVEGTVGDAIVG